MEKDFVIFDWEVFPEWNCMVWNVYNGTDNIEFHVISSDDKDYYKKLKEAAYKGYLCGFNIKGYDMQMLDLALKGYTPAELYEHNEEIINSNDGKFKSLSYWRRFDFTDLYDDMKGMGSLKQFESNTGLLIKESSVPFGKRNLTEQEKEDIITYCKHDVFATNRLLTARMGYIEAKATCSKLSDLSEAECLKNTAAKVCAKMLKAKQSENYGDDHYQPPEKLKSIFEQLIHPTILENFYGVELSNEFSYEVRYLKNHFVYGAGGVHSTYKDSLYYISDDEYILVDADFENLYPSLIIVYNYYAAGIPEDGKELFKFLKNECHRLKAKLKEMRNAGLSNTEEYSELYRLRDAIKLILNASTGAMRNKYSPLYDPKAIIALCMTGQLLATCVAKKCHDMGALIIQTNTDGVIFKVKRSDLQAVKDMLNDFAKQVKVNIDIDEEYAIFQKDVNNYILFAEKDSKPKLKGRWAKKSGSEVPLSPLNAPVINDAIMSFYSKNIPFEDSILKETKPLNFMMTTMRGPTYNGVLYADETGENPTYNVNRVYATTNINKGTLYKYACDETGQIIKHDKIASIPEHCSLFNDKVPDILDLPDIDYKWYIERAKKNAIEMERLA